MPCKVDLLQAMEWLKIAWNSVKPETIKNCFGHVGFTESLQLTGADLPEEIISSKWERIQQAGLAEDLTFEEFALIDENVLVGPETNEDSIDEILDQSLPSPGGINGADDEDMDGEVAPIPPLPTFSDAMSSLHLLQRYLRSLAESQEVCHLLAVIRERCVDAHLENQVQTRITDYFGSETV